MIQLSKSIRGGLLEIAICIVGFLTFSDGFARFFIK